MTSSDLVPSRIHVDAGFALYDWTFKPRYRVTVSGRPFWAGPEETIEERDFWNPVQAASWVDSWGWMTYTQAIPHRDPFVSVWEFTRAAKSVRHLEFDDQGVAVLVHGEEDDEPRLWVNRSMDAREKASYTAQDRRSSWSVEAHDDTSEILADWMRENLDGEA
jgi:hypothetical protein